MKRLFGLILASLMLLCACTVQADVLTEWNMTQGSTSDLIHKDVASTTVSDAVVTVEEVAYDGVTAFVFYTLKDTKTTELLGTLDSETGRYLINGDDYACGQEYRLVQRWYPGKRQGIRYAADGWPVLWQ